MSAFDIIAVIAVAGYVVGRQLLGEPLRLKRVVILPTIVTIVGVVRLSSHGRQPTATDIAFIAGGAVLAAVIGLAQGARLRIEARDGALWGRMPPKGLWLWVALIVSHLALDLVASSAGAHVAASTAPIILILGVNRLGQAAVIGARAVRSGIPFAPEAQGGGLLGGGLLGGGRTSGSSGGGRRRGLDGVAGMLNGVMQQRSDTSGGAATPPGAAPEGASPEATGSTAPAEGPQPVDPSSRGRGRQRGLDRVAGMLNDVLQQPAGDQPSSRPSPPVQGPPSVLGGGRARREGRRDGRRRRR